MNTESIKQALLAQRNTIDSILAQLDEKPKERWLSVSEAAEYLGISTHTVRTRAKSGVMEYKLTDGGGKMFVKVA